jgi:hypothetical protein
MGSRARSNRLRPTPPTPHAALRDRLNHAAATPRRARTLTTRNNPPRPALTRGQGDALALADRSGHEFDVAGRAASCPYRTTSVTRPWRGSVAALISNESHGLEDAQARNRRSGVADPHVRRDRFDLGRPRRARDRNGDGRVVSPVTRRATAPPRKRSSACGPLDVRMDPSARTQAGSPMRNAEHCLRAPDRVGTRPVPFLL